MNKRVGEAQSWQEQRLEKAIAAVAAWQACDITYRPVSGGISNANWRVEVAGAPNAYFVKIPGEGTERFIDRNTAHEASLKAAQTGYGAPVFAWLPELGVEIFEFMEGWRASSNQDFQQQAVRHRALHALKSFNDQARLKQTKTVFDMLDEHREQVKGLNACLSPDVSWLHLQVERARDALHAAGLDYVPCMNDTLAGNFMLNEAGDIRLVDFEYASNNDRCYELALWFGEMFFTPKIERELIEDYFGRFDLACYARVQIHKFLADMKWSTWAVIQHNVADIDFDFSKYGAWKTMRARSVLNHPDWEEWLRAL
ncbi:MULTISPECIES: choline/ethanolamine kinase family protein [Klebsiella pneumoniae complex]|jgi:thiamine kinase-like enzyme|uniref:choline/ethanolamine kinase family protein n=1 Tax=Klebsiella pneumoniae complex TaxID=3390273 RepID=UPI0007CA57CA|nr:MULTISPECIES: choline/ethanolamine kinase family protein [Klebsiella]MDP1091960.1 choline/ethanolamine kinase family protein [Klebsiella pneumoniae]TYG04159.1 choline/ethanolamine kinase--aminoglycoside phosphotransferase [Klebsiella variicola]SAT41097.1 CTP:phosphocholine cytidylyltransferase involved in choline phosphorylation for cell surface LPS epitopes [Klebsiella pneumoniae]HBY0021920.1 choline/ethanolamine kinase--aminoglycoside phosphotransferase [Klebsiella pneumoniae]